MAICLITGRCSSDRVFLSTSYNCVVVIACVFVCFFPFFSFLFAALVANKVIIIGRNRRLKGARKTKKRVLRWRQRNGKDWKNIKMQRSAEWIG